MSAPERDPNMIVQFHDVAGAKLAVRVFCANIVQTCPFPRNFARTINKRFLLTDCSLLRKKTLGLTLSTGRTVVMDA